VIRVWEDSDSLGALDAITAVGRKTSSQIGSGSVSAADRENDGIPCFTRAKGQAGSARLDLELRNRRYSNRRFRTPNNDQ
jgi:hypothetical protein